MHRSDGDASGAQVQMKRLCNGFKNRGVNARILCRERTSHDSVLMPYRPRAERWLQKVTKRLGLNDVHLISSAGVASLPEFQEADLLDIHCFHSGTFSYLSLPNLTRNKAVVFTFHDMWPITGHCHASLECDRWKTGCGACPHLDIHPPVIRDATAIEWILKKWIYQQSRFSIVTPSRWLRDRVKESMLHDHQVHMIPHGVNTQTFKPLDKNACRQRLNITPGKNVIMCAMESMWRPLKGADLLVHALEQLPPALTKDSVLLFFGNSNREILDRIRIPVVELGYIHDDEAKAVAYSAADVFIHPTRAESFGLVALESIACGTPVVAFHVGGLTEIVRDGITGSLAMPEDPRDLSNKIRDFFVGSREFRAEMSDRCRRIAEHEYPLSLQIERYLNIYRDLIQTNQS